MMFIALKLGQIVIVLLLVSFAKCCLTKEIFILNEAEIKPILAQVQPKVDIHVHLEGSLMDATAYELLT